jgi:hypothetical protein
MLRARTTREYVYASPLGHSLNVRPHPEAGPTLGLSIVLLACVHIFVCYDHTCYY